ncbi:MAG TPA: sulfatase [Pirellulales bacterium]
MLRVALYCLVALAYQAPNTYAAQSPNVVLIVADDHAWTDYSFMGHPHVATPHIDRLARESAAFTHGYVPSSLCCPSLASMITGLYPHQHKITSNDPPIPAGMPAGQFHRSPEFTAGREVMNRFLETVPTLPRLLGERGYTSLQTGKWWQGDFRRGGFTHGMTRGERHGDQGLDIGRKTMQPIYDFITESRRADKPFFVWYAPMMPHTPHTPPERLLKKYEPLTDSPHVARYWAMIEWFDETVGELLTHLENEKLAEDTIVVYLADNGWIQSQDSPLYAEKSKQSQYDGGLRTPILVRWPKKIPARTCETPILSIDIVPTILAAIGQQPTKEMQGLNLLDDKAVVNRKTIFGECFTHNAIDLERPAANLRWRWAISAGKKLIVPDPKNESDAVVELYDLAVDPQETKNLASAHPNIVSKMRDELDAWWNPAKD